MGVHSPGYVKGLLEAEFKQSVMATVRVPSWLSASQNSCGREGVSISNMYSHH